MASSLKEEKKVDDSVPSSVSVETMSDSEVSSWIDRLIRSAGVCIGGDSKRNFLLKYLQRLEACAAIQIIGKSKKDVTVVELSTKPTVKQLADKFQVTETMGPGQTAVKKQAANSPLKDKQTITAKNSIGDGRDNNVDSGPNKLHTTGTSAKPVSYETSTENKIKGKSKKDATVVELSTKPTVKQLADKFQVAETMGPGQTAVNKEAANSPLKDKQTITAKNSIGDGRDNNVDSGPNKLHTTGTSAKPVSYETSTENKLQTNKVVFRPEATYVDNLTYGKLAAIMEGLYMDTKSLEDDKQRLKQRLFSGQRNQSFSHEIKDVLNRTVQKYKFLKKKLLEQYSDLITTVQNESFKKKMSEVTEMRFPQYEVELQSIRTMLQKMKDEFEIVVCGETSSGKSTFLNVLLGERILPSHHLHTTASLCRLHNSKNRRIECIVGNRLVDSMTLKADSSELMGKLESITKELLSKDGDDQSLKVIDIYWPVSSLHENVVLVDTPGIGERDALTRQVVEYVPKSAGYIFIVDSAHAGGVQDSGIIKLIEAIAVSASKEDHIKNLSNAIFVCNKWDLVPKQDREAVLEDTKKKIGKYCGQLDDWQIVQFNADLELKLLEWKANPTDDFNILQKSLETLMIRTIVTRLRENHRWLHTFVMDVEGLVNVRVTAAELSEKSVHDKIKKARGELELATNELKQYIEVEAMIKKEQILLLQALQKYLRSADVNKRFDWTNCAPEPSDVDEDDGFTLIRARLQDVILEWATAETGPSKQTSVRITDKCEQMQDTIGSRISAVNNLQLGFRLPKCSDQSGSPFSDIRDTLSGKEITIAAAASPIWITVGLIGLVVALIPELGRAILPAVQVRTRSIEKMTKMTTKAISKLLSENHLQAFITDTLTGPHSKWLTKFRNDTRCKIVSALETIHQMEQDLHMSKDTLQMFKALQTKLNGCSKCLQELEKDI